MIFWSGTLAMTEIESVVDPDCVTDDIWRKFMAFICVHGQIIPDVACLLGRTNRAITDSATALNNATSFMDADQLLAAQNTEDAREGTAAFFENRYPEFKCN
ncbi:MAG: hypothetical protein ACI9GW_003093 [Halieaceae bacterium]